MPRHDVSRSGPRGARRRARRRRARRCSSSPSPRWSRCSCPGSPARTTGCCWSPRSSVSPWQSRSSTCSPTARRCSAWPTPPPRRGGSRRGCASRPTPCGGRKPHRRRGAQRRRGQERFPWQLAPIRSVAILTTVGLGAPMDRSPRPPTLRHGQRRDARPPRASVVAPRPPGRRRRWCRWYRRTDGSAARRGGVHAPARPSQPGSAVAGADPQCVVRCARRLGCESLARPALDQPRDADDRTARPPPGAGHGGARRWPVGRGGAR